MTVPRVLGVDLSLTSTGLALSDVRGLRVALVPTSTVTGYAQALYRLQRIRLALTEWLTQPVDLAVLEDPSQAGHATAVSAKLSERSGLFWLTLDLFDRLDVPFGVASPATLKGYATGNGNASKDAMVAAAREAFPRAGVRKDDEADAAWLAAMGCRRLGAPIDAGTPRRLTDMGKAEWPPLLSD